MIRGLSPLARGNQGGDAAHVRNCGPIPARAGEPVALSSISSSDRAYPRSRGGTPMSVISKARVWGLSPLARGSQQITDVLVPLQGPIPARAGEPFWRLASAG